MVGPRKCKAAPLIGVWLSFTSGAAMADDITASPSGRREIREQGLVASLTARAPDQLYAFYSARGFPEDALHEITRHCFLTISIRNERNDIVWLELDRWRIIGVDGHDLARMPRTQWDALWERLRLAPAKRATFGWTQLPELRDLHPGEPVGGNLSLLPPATTFALEAHFATGADKLGPALRLRFDKLNCVSDQDV